MKHIACRDYSSFTQSATTGTHLPKIKGKSRRGTQTDVTEATNPHTRQSEDIIYETPKREHVRNYDDDNYASEFLEEDAN
jgi:hypothetical protein